MHFKSDRIAKFKVPDFILNGETIELVTEFKYLGHILTNNMKDDNDIERQRRTLFILGNTLIRTFYMCTFEVKIELFSSYCPAKIFSDYNQKAVYSISQFIKYLNWSIQKRVN